MKLLPLKKFVFFVWPSLENLMGLNATEQV